MKMVLTVKMSKLALRKLCIEQGWYTKESDKERDQQLYLQTELFNNVVMGFGSDSAQSMDRLMVIAADILDHSDIETKNKIEYDNQLNYIARMVYYECVRHMLEPVY